MTTVYAVSEETKLPESIEQALFALGSGPLLVSDLRSAVLADLASRDRALREAREEIVELRRDCDHLRSEALASALQAGTAEARAREVEEILEEDERRLLVAKERREAIERDVANARAEVASARGAALEEAARACDDRAEDADFACEPGAACEARACANAIRALSSSPAATAPASCPECCYRQDGPPPYHDAGCPNAPKHARGGR